MDLSFETVKITAPSNFLHWGGCFAENGFFLALEAEGDEEKEAVVCGREILDIVLTRFTDSQKRNLAVVRDIIDEVSQWKSLTSLIIGVLAKDILYLGSVGEGEVLLNRKGIAKSILGANETASGRLLEGDVLLFSSKTFISQIDIEKRKHITTFSDKEEKIMEGMSGLFSQNETAGAAALVISIKNSSANAEIIPKISTLVSFWQRLRFWLKKKLIFIKAQDENFRSKRNLIAIATVLIFILIASVFLNLADKKTSERRKKVSQALELVSHQYEEAVSLVDINPQRSRTLLESSRVTLGSLLSELPKNSDEYKNINDWLGKVSEQVVSAYKIYKLTAVPVFFDLALIKDGGEGQDIEGYEETKVILDKKNKLLYSLSTKTKRASIVVGGDIVKEGVSIAVHGNNAYILNNDGVVRVDLTSKNASVVVRNEEDFGDITSIASYGGNIYLLDRKVNVIWKYMGTNEGFSGRYRYLNPDVKVDFSRTISMKIDGSVWTASSNNITKFTKGLPDNFSIQDFPETIEGIVAIYTSDKDSYLYILDKATSRILVFDKEGKYYSQYQWDELKNASDFVVTESEKKIYVLIGGKIYGIELK